MNSEKLKQLMLSNADEINRMYSRMDETHREVHLSAEKFEEWRKACDDFHSRYGRLAWPVSDQPGSWLERIKSGEPESVEAALCFLECRPYFFRSGYMFKDILRKVKQASMPPEQSIRLQAFLEKYANYLTTRVRPDHYPIAKSKHKRSKRG